MPPPPIPSVRRPAPSPRATPRTLLAAALFTGFVFGCVCTAGTVAAVLALSSSPSAGGKGNFLAASLPSVSPAAASRTFTREEFRKAFMGRTLSEIRKELGAPDDVDISNGCWYYNRRTSNPGSGKLDAHATLQHYEDRIQFIGFKE